MNNRFRVWSPSRKGWMAIGMSIQDFQKDAVNSFLLEVDTIMDEEDVIIQQYTGVDDINGVNIYEGDILREKYCKWPQVVQFNNENYGRVMGWNTMNKMEDGSFEAVEFYYGDGPSSLRHEVIGNIFESPELLEQQ